MRSNFFPFVFLCECNHHDDNCDGYDGDGDDDDDGDDEKEEVGRRPLFKQSTPIFTQ